MSEWGIVIIALASVVTILSRLRSVTIRFKDDNSVQGKFNGKQLGE
jgi:hypothetical protein